MASRLRPSLAFLALRELGPQQLALYAWYRLLLRSGYLRRRTPDLRESKSGNQGHLIPRSDLFSLPDTSELNNLLAGQLSQVFAQADEVDAGQNRLFGGEPVPLQLSPSGTLLHWTEYAHGDDRIDGIDIKLIWEPARFGWVFPLARAYHLNQDERYAAAFWRNSETFLAANPANLGPNWASGQEVALRLIALAFAWQVFHPSPHSTPARAAFLGKALAAHAARIPPGLAYARAQNNNHLLTEAAGLLTAGLVLPDHPSARSWIELGWKWFNLSLQDQIAGDGTYNQHSTNYHRLVLQVALWVNSLGRPFPQAARQRLTAATRWLLALLDPISGEVPNLGHNDGALIFPLTSLPFEDYRPVLQASAYAFLGKPAFPPGAWDEMSAWFGVGTAGSVNSSLISLRDANQGKPAILESPSGDSWAYLRAARFTSRPAHADQLHLDLWWRGLNLALDPGTYLYNAPPPWENALRVTQVHNTVTVDDQDQMTPAGRFLWLKWAQAELCEPRAAQDGQPAQVSAQHDGYVHLGLIHRRIVTFENVSRLVVEDRLLPANEKDPLNQHSFHLHWLLPDWPWEGLSEVVRSHHFLHLKSPLGWIDLHVQLPSSDREEHPGPVLSARLVRAGELLVGNGPVQPYSGWYSPTYAQKVPALSLSFRWSSRPPSTVISVWSFPD